jgi:penicillin-binding protein 1C
VVTTLDAAIQNFALDVLDRQIAGLNAQNVRDGAVIVVDNASGEVLAYVGSSGGHSQSRMVDGVRAPRQAGSTLKPFLYGLAVERGYLTAASLLDDSPINLETSTGLYIPQNYDRDFKGIVSLRTALASSLNVPAVRTLVLTGLDVFHDRLQALGYESLKEDAEFYGYALALGSSEASLLEHVNAYRTLANGGVFSPLRFKPGEPMGKQTRLMSRESAFIISDILSDRASRSLTFGLANPLATRYWTAVKTGTSKNMRDNWCIGYSSDYTVAVWVGNFEGDAMWDVSGITGAAPIWLEIMNTLHARRASRAPAPPKGVVARQVHFEPAVEPDRREWFLKGTETNLVSLVPPGTSAPRITYPANGMIIAVDPDIPHGHQAVLFQSSAHAKAAHWVLNGTELGVSAAPLRWVPVPGSYKLALTGENGQPLDEIRFQVRGTKK